MSLALRYAAVLAVLAAGDALWLSWFAPNVFRPAIGAILLDNVRWTPIILFYLLYGVGVLAFPVALGDARGSWPAAAGYGALFGLMCYMAYDLTNLATIRAWQSSVAMMDMGWGAFLTALAALAGYGVAQRF